MSTIMRKQWPTDWKCSTYVPIFKKGDAKECRNYATIALISKEIDARGGAT